MFYNPILFQALIKYFDCKKAGTIFARFFENVFWNLKTKYQFTSLVIYFHNVSASSYSFYTKNILWRSCKVAWTKWNYSAGIYLFKVDNENTRTVCEIYTKLTIRLQNEVIDIVLVFLLLTLNRFHTLLWYFHYWLWPNKCWLGRFFLCREVFK